MVTFTLPSELRGMFFGPLAKDAYDIFFAAAAQALGDCLANPKWLGAATGGFTAILHTWNQQLLTHLHLHVIVPAAGIDAAGRVVVGKSDKFLVHIPALQACFRHQFRQRLKALDWKVDPANKSCLFRSAHPRPPKPRSRRDLQAVPAAASP